MKSRKLKPLRILHKQAWDLQSKEIRKSSANFQDYCSCYTCDIMKHWKEMDVGHYLHNKLDFYRNNLRVQCARCNRFLHGNLGIYGERLCQEIGYEEVQRMRLYSFKKGNNYNRKELENILNAKTGI